MSLDTYGHVLVELSDTERRSAEDEIRAARGELVPTRYLEARGRSRAETGRRVGHALPVLPAQRLDRSLCHQLDWIARSAADVPVWYLPSGGAARFPSGSLPPPRGWGADAFGLWFCVVASCLPPLVQSSTLRDVETDGPRACDVFVQPATLVLRSAWAIRSKSCHLPGRPVPSSDPQRPTASMTPLQVIKLGDHRVVNPQPGEPDFLSAASGVAWSSTRLYSVGDDQATVAEYQLDPTAVLEALRLGQDTDVLRPGLAKRIIPDVLPIDPKERASKKADFEALTLVRRSDIDGLSHPERAEILRRFPHGLLMMSGSGGMSWEGFRRSTCVVYSLDDQGHIAGLPGEDLPGGAARLAGEASIRSAVI